MLPSPKQVYVVFPSFFSWQHPHFWSGFGAATAGELLKSFGARIPLKENEIELGQHLWQAYKNSNLAELTKLSDYQSTALPYLQPVVQAHTDRLPRKAEREDRKESWKKLSGPGRLIFQVYSQHFRKGNPFMGSVIFS